VSDEAFNEKRRGTKRKELLDLFRFVIADVDLLQQLLLDGTDCPDCGKGLENWSFHRKGMVLKIFGKCNSSNCREVGSSIPVEWDLMAYSLADLHSGRPWFCFLRNLAPSGKKNRDEYRPTLSRVHETSDRRGKTTERREDHSRYTVVKPWVSQQRRIRYLHRLGHW